jgi:hypothetical protein
VVVVMVVVVIVVRKGKKNAGRFDAQRDFFHSFLDLIL